MESGAWPLFRYNPKLKAEGKNPLILDSKEPTADIGEYMYNEIRFRALKQVGPGEGGAAPGGGAQGRQGAVRVLQVPGGQAVAMDGVRAERVFPYA